MPIGILGLDQDGNVMFKLADSEIVAVNLESKMFKSFLKNCPTSLVSHSQVSILHQVSRIHVQCSYRLTAKAKIFLMMIGFCFHKEKNSP